MNPDLVLMEDLRTNVLEKLVDALGKFIKDRWHLVEPAPIVFHRQLKKTWSQDDIDEDNRNKLIPLINRTNIEHHE